MYLCVRKLRRKSGENLESRFVPHCHTLTCLFESSIESDLFSRRKLSRFRSHTRARTHRTFTYIRSRYVLRTRSLSYQQFLFYNNLDRRRKRERETKKISHFYAFTRGNFEPGKRKGKNLNVWNCFILYIDQRERYMCNNARAQCSYFQMTNGGQRGCRLSQCILKQVVYTEKNMCNVKTDSIKGTRLNITHDDDERVYFTSRSYNRDCLSRLSSYIQRAVYIGAGRFIRFFQPLKNRWLRALHSAFSTVIKQRAMHLYDKFVELRINMVVIYGASESRTDVHISRLIGGYILRSGSKRCARREKQRDTMISRYNLSADRDN